MLALIWIHIASGALAVLAGAWALVARKGGLQHRRGGQVFAGSMALSAATGATIGLLVPDQRITFYAGLLTLYLIASGVLAARRSAPGKRWPEAVLAVAGAAIAATLLAMAWFASASADGSYAGYPTVAYGFLGGIALLGSGFDVRRLVTRQRTPERRSRISQHLWRMSVAFFIAAGSAFTGPGAGAFPEWLRESGALSIPEPAILLVMLFWLVRLRFKRGAVSTAA